MNRLSRDQNGYAASSVPGSGCAVSDLMGRIHNKTLPDASRAEKASVPPSGETTTLVLVRPNVTNMFFSGGSTKNRVTDDARGRGASHHRAALVIVAATRAESTTGIARFQNGRGGPT